MTKLVALTVRWFDREPDADEHRRLVLRELGRLPTAEDVAEAERVLAGLR